MIPLTDLDCKHKSTSKAQVHWRGGFSVRRHSRNNIRFLDDSADLVEDGLAHGHLLPDHCVVLVVGVVCVPELTAAGELELHELVPELTLVPHTDP